MKDIVGSEYGLAGAAFVLCIRTATTSCSGERALQRFTAVVFGAMTAEEEGCFVDVGHPIDCGRHG